MIRFLNVSLEHIPDKGIKDVSFRVERGEFILLSGPTGAGKTTILRLLTFELAPNSGQILIEGQFQHYHQKKDIAMIRHKMGIVFPEARLLPDRTVFDNVALPLRIAGDSRKRISLQANRLLYRFGLKDRALAYPMELSSGEQKKAAIVRALIARPFILLADEPLANVDAHATADVLEHLAQINAEGMTVLAATHIPEPYEGIANRTIHLRNGRVVD
jgi:cell division transport system ATP-binding protein